MQRFSAGGIIGAVCRFWTRVLMLILPALLISAATTAQSELPAQDKYMVLAALTLNFVRFTEWPEPALAGGGNVRVCVVGDNIVQEAFASLEGKTVAQKTAEVVNANRLRNLSACHILFVGELSKNLLVQVFLDAKQQPILTLGEDMSFLEAGGMVSMVNTDGRIRLYIDLALVKTAKLNISSNLLRLATIVGAAGGKLP